MIRDYRPSDLEVVVTVFQLAVREVASRDYTPEQIAAWAPDDPDLDAWKRRLESGGVFVFDGKDGIAGFVRVDREGCLDLLYVHPRAQRQGVARALLARAVSWAGGQSLIHLHSEVSATARPFFESAGFRVSREQVVERRGVSFRNFYMERNVRGRPKS